MRTIIKLAGVKLTERKKLVIKKNKPMPTFTSATVTPLVIHLKHLQYAN